MLVELSVTLESSFVLPPWGTKEEKSPIHFLSIRGPGSICCRVFSHLFYCMSLLDPSVRQKQIFMQAPQVHFVKVVLFRFDDEWMTGHELGQELWITELVFSELALGKV